MANSRLGQGPMCPPRLDGRQLRLFAGMLVGLLAILACAHPGTTPHALPTAPASQLSLSIEIDGEYASDPGSPPSNQIALRVDLRDANGPIILSQGQSFACDGVTTSFPSSKPLTVRRQPPGGGYTCVYTDERGVQTQVTIPVPPGTWRVTSPPDGGQEPIPVGTGVLTVTYDYPHLPPGASSQVNVIAACYATYPDCRADSVDQGPATGRITIPFVSPGTPPADSAFVPGQGWINLIGRMTFTIPASGFHTTQVQYFDSIVSYVTWT